MENIILLGLNRLIHLGELFKHLEKHHIQTNAFLTTTIVSIIVAEIFAVKIVMDHPVVPDLRIPVTQMLKIGHC